MATTDGAEGLHSAVHEIRPVTDMDVEIDETRREIHST
jgi:hypothetical protein